MFKQMTFAFLFSVAIFGSTEANAAFVVGTAGVVDLGTTMASPTNTLSTATSFTLQGITVAGQSSGDFTKDTNVNESLGNTTLNLSNPATFTFGSAAFGTFTGSSIFSDAVGQNSRAFDIIGTFAAGTDFTSLGYAAGTETASFTISFTQAGGPGTTISASGTLSTPPSYSSVAAPEPASIAMVVLGLGLAGVARRIRRTGK